MAKPVPFQPDDLYKTRIVDPQNGMVSWVWTQHFQQAAQQLAAPVSTAAPAASTDPVKVNVNGVPIASDGQYLYIAVGPNQWKRIPLTAF